MKTIENNSPKSITFCTAIWLGAECVKMKDPGSNNNFTVDLNSNNLSAQASDKHLTQYHKLSTDDKVTVEIIFYFMDKFGVGDQFVH